jgi:hypothetical protein
MAHVLLSKRTAVPSSTLPRTVGQSQRVTTIEQPLTPRVYKACDPIGRSVVAKQGQQNGEKCHLARSILPFGL